MIKFLCGCKTHKLFYAAQVACIIFIHNSKSIPVDGKFCFYGLFGLQNPAFWWGFFMKLISINFMTIFLFMNDSLENKITIWH